MWHNFSKGSMEKEDLSKQNKQWKKVWSNEKSCIKKMVLNWNFFCWKWCYYSSFSFTIFCAWDGHLIKNTQFQIPKYVAHMYNKKVMLLKNTHKQVIVWSLDIILSHVIPNPLNKWKLVQKEKS
jgi:hypothetical protein